VDDAGAGFASFRHILELRPDFVKLDIGLVREIDHDDVRQALVAGIVYFARKSGCQLIAEGIETTGERDQLRMLGVALGVLPIQVVTGTRLIGG
jgi:EAL domain-containing protein (putative c-di-GMP-specific phosphodiesterase class I)